MSSNPHSDEAKADRDPGATGKVTLAEVARAAGVSLVTASRSLRNDPHNSAATRRRVQEVAERLGYRPNPLVAALMADLRQNRPSAAGTLALMSDQTREAFMKDNRAFQEFLQGVTQQAGRWGFRTEFFHYGRPDLSADRAVQILQARGIQGLLFLPVRVFGTTLPFRLDSFACAKIGYSVIRPEMPTAVHNHFQGISLALAELRQLGVRRIGLVTERDLESRINHLWTAAMLVYQRSIPASQRLADLEIEQTNTPKQQADFEKWVARVRPEAILCGGRTVRHMARQAGLVGRADLHCVSLTRESEGGFSYVDGNDQLVGAAAVDLLVGQLYRNERGLPELPKLTLLPGTWHPHSHA